mmetsp:Transcript_7310/g.12706  ORF Transcript_7310/g.12706 Transcript_7310/m.12706 type:complete len:147 (+) Transcript_7310:207-647(+)
MPMAEGVHRPAVSKSLWCPIFDVYGCSRFRRHRPPDFSSALLQLALFGSQRNMQLLGTQIRLAMRIPRSLQLVLEPAALPVRDIEFCPHCTQLTSEFCDSFRDVVLRANSKGRSCLVCLPSQCVHFLLLCLDFKLQLMDIGNQHPG